MRTFVAAPCPPEQPLGAALLSELAPRQWRLVPGERRHITLRFLGEVPDVRVPELVGLLAPLGMHAAFRLTVQGCGAFPDARRPEVLWLGCGAGREALAALAQAVGDALGLHPEGRPFRGHVTVARRRAGTAPAEAAAALAQQLPRWRATDWGAFMVDRVQLLASELRPDGPRYTPLATVPLLVR